MSTKTPNQATTEIKQEIVNIVNEHGPIKGISLVEKITLFDWKRVKNQDLAIIDPIPLIEKLCIEGKIMDVEYTLPTSENRIKSMYFPAGTEVKVIGY